MTGPGSATPSVTLASDQALPDKRESPLCSTTPDTSHEDTTVPAEVPVMGVEEGRKQLTQCRTWPSPVGTHGAIFFPL